MENPGTAGRRLPIGAEILPDGGVEFRVWAPRRKTVEVAIDGRFFEMEPLEGGYFSAVVGDAGAGTRYRYRLDGGDAFPDPASRFQPEGPHGPSEVVDPSRYKWSDAAWRGLPILGQVIYEMHIGTFTRGGTWASALPELPALAAAGITVLEMMPVADFVGRYGWGYDGVNLYAPTHLYGSPDDLRRFVDYAHSLGMAVILDVVYNHFGPDGNYLAQFSPDYFTDKYSTDWGEAINYDGPNSGPVREFVTENAGYWIGEYHMDGLRLDATQNIYDDSKDHILAALTRRAKKAANGRRTILVAENEPQHVKLIGPPEDGGYGLDGLWNDDLHHSSMVAMTGRKEAYYTDYRGTPQEFISAFKYGYLYQGQWYKWQKQRRGTPAFGLPPSAFVTFTQNHDQIANSGRGIRAHLLTSPGLYKTVTAMMLLGPGTPMLFQGQEFASSAPFYFFADHKPELRLLIEKGRREFLYQWESMKTGQMDACFVDPGGEETFERCKLDHSEREKHTEEAAFVRDLLRLRREDPGIHSPEHFDGAVLSGSALVLRFFRKTEGDRLLLANLGLDLEYDPAPEPLLAPPEDQEWQMVFSTEDPKYGGCGTAPLDGEKNWQVPGWTAVVLRPRPRPAAKKDGRS